MLQIEDVGLSPLSSRESKQIGAFWQSLKKKGMIRPKSRADNTPSHIRPTFVSPTPP